MAEGAYLANRFCLRYAYIFIHDGVNAAPFKVEWSKLHYVTKPQTYALISVV